MAAVPSAPAPEVDSEGQPIAPPRRSLYNKQATGLQATLTLAVYSLGIIYGVRPPLQPHESERAKTDGVPTLFVQLATPCLPSSCIQDIGTSPLYVLNAVFPTDGEVPSAEDVIGAISA